jgi:hypothetical protein
MLHRVRGLPWCLLALLPGALFACSGESKNQLSAGPSGAGATGGGAGAGAASGGAGAGPASGGAGAGPASGGAGAGAGGGAAGGGSLRPCDDACTIDLDICCDGHCINPYNDPFNCGACGARCEGATPGCYRGACVAPDCFTPDACAAAGASGEGLCCGAQCCTGGTLCCEVPAPARDGGWGCVDPALSGGTCPLGCNMCRCAAPDTPIATPSGERAIATLRVGDLVYSSERGVLVTVPIRAVHREPVTTRHSVARVTLENGAVLDVSRGHPTVDGRTFGDVRAGDRLGDVSVLRVEPSVPYQHAFTYDILPDSTTGAYFAAGALIGSTLAAGQCDE